MPIKKPRRIQRCSWCGDDPLYVDYHDKEWGVPLHDDQKLFEFLILEGMQAGLSWITVLKKRDNFRQAFDDFDPALIAKYKTRKKQQLLNNAGIIRNRLKIDATILNAQIYLEIVEEYGSFDKYIWQFVDGKPQLNTFKTLKQLPSSTPASDIMCKTLKKRGFKFIGTTICYAFMQATGMVNDHVVDCFRYKQVGTKPRKKRK